MAARAQTVARGPNFNPSEDRLLALAYIHVSQDPAVGNSQRSGNFWKSVCAQFAKLKGVGGVDRSAQSLESQFGTMAHDVSKLCACHQQIVDLNESGKTAEDNFQDALELYKQKHPKNQDFKFVEAWRVLKEYPRFGEVFDKKKDDAKKKRKQPLNDVTNVVDLTAGSDFGGSSPDESGPDGSYKRPMGNKMAKEGLKAKNGIQAALMENARASAAMATALLEKIHLMKHDSQIALFAYKEDLDMCDASIEFFSLRKKQELRKYKQSLAVEDLGIHDDSYPESNPPMHHGNSSSALPTAFCSQFPSNGSGDFEGIDLTEGTNNDEN